MSDKFDDSLSFLSEPEKVSEKAPSPQKKGRYNQFQTGLEDISHSEAARATGSKSMAGQYKRFTLYLSPEDIARFKEVAEEIGLSQAETGRWFFQYMFERYDKGLRPETEPVVIRRQLKRE